LIGVEKYFKASVAIPLFIKDGEEFFLFEKRAADIRQGGEVSLPGGQCELTEKDSYLTAIRETSEELGINQEKIQYIGKYGFLFTPFGSVIDVHLIKLLINDLDDIKYDQSEVQSVFTLPVKYFLDNEPEIYFVKSQVIPNYFDTSGKFIELFPANKFNLPDKYSKPWETHKHRILLYNTLPQIVWGITAEIIFDFINTLKKVK
jgi:8-oxo-dGTP pyrophosphatase MutT (NUDIX family)